MPIPSDQRKWLGEGRGVEMYTAVSVSAGLVSLYTDVVVIVVLYSAAEAGITRTGMIEWCTT